MKVVIDFGNAGLKVNATIKKDGDQWCVLAGKNLQVGVAGFGSTITAAIEDFKAHVRHQ